MSAIPPQNRKHNSAVQTRRKMPFTHGMEIENFITNKRGDILEDGKELVAVWDQMFNGALNYLKSLTSSSTKVPEYIRKKIKRVTRKDVKRHGKIIRYVQIHYQVNGSTIAINVFGPDPNISQITWLLELVTPPCEYLEEMDWWINTLYLAASTSITKGYNIQPLGFNPFQSEYRAGVTCGEHHHLGGFKTLKEKKAIYNMIRAYIPHLIALSSTSPFIEGKPTGRTLLKKGSDGRTMVLAPDCTRSIRLRENSGQLGPNIPEYLPYVGPSFTQKQFSRYVRKEIPDDRYVDAYPFTIYGTIELRFFDAQYDQRIRMAIIILLQAIALKGAKYVRSGNKLPEVKGNTLYEHRKRAVNFGMFAKFQGDPSIESEGGAFVKYYNHNPDTGGPPGKIFESLKSLLIWLKPELAELHVTKEEIAPLLIMLYGTARIAPPISATTFMFYLYEQSHGNISTVIKSLSLLNGKPRKAFCEVLGRPNTTFSELFNTKVAQPKRITDSTKSSLARKLQVESRSRRKTAMGKERARLKAKQSLKTKMLREKVKKDKMLEQQRLQRLKKLEKAKKPPPRVVSSKSISTLSRRPITQPKRTPSKSTRKKSSQIKAKPSTARTSTRTASSRKPVRKTPVKSITRKPTTKQKAKKTVTKSTARKPTSKQTTARKPTSKKTTKQSKRTKVISQAALRSKKTSAQSTKKKPQAYASTASSNYSRKQVSYPKPKSGQKTTTSHIVRKKTTVKKAVSTTRTTTSVADQEEYKDFKFIRNVSIANYPNRIDYGMIIPAVRIRWKRSILQSMVKLPVSVEAEVSAINKSSRFRKTVFREKINLENAALRDECYLPIPINFNNAIGEFQIKFIVRNLKDRKILATTYRYLTKIRAKTRTHSLKKVSIPPNQVGDSLINLRGEVKKRNTRGKITIFAISQRGIIKLYEKKSKFGQTKISLDIPILIPPSICSSNWFVYVIFNARGSNEALYTKTSPPLSKIINISLSGTPQLKSRVKTNFTSMITPKLGIKTRCEIHEVEIIQISRDSKKVIKRYRMKTRIRKGEKFVLESFHWKAPSVRKGLFSRAKQKTISLVCKISDNFGVINETMIGLVETPTTITVYRP